MIRRFGASGEPLSEDAQTLLELFATVGSAPDLVSLLERLAPAMRELTGAEYAVLATYDAEGGVKELATAGVDPTCVRQAVTERAGVLDRVVRAGNPLRLDADADGPLGLPSVHPPVHTMLVVPILSAGQQCGLFYLANKTDGPFTETDEALVHATVSKPLSAVLTHARAEEESERRRLWLEALTRASASLASGVLRSGSLAAVVENLRHVTGAHIVAIVDGNSSPLEISALAGDPERAVHAVEELRELIVETGSTARVSRVPRPSGDDTFLVPLRTEVAPAGVLLVDYAGGESLLTGFEEDLVVMFAEQAGLAIDRVYALEDRHQSILTSDRDRIARDLHDLVIQRLFATGLHLQGSRPLAPPPVQERIDRTVADLDASIRDIRSSIFELGHGTKGPLREVARDVIAEYIPLLGFAPVLRCSGPVTLAMDSAGAEHAIAILREALSNAARHAQATSVCVELEATDESLVLRVNDDGVGLSDEVAENRSGGLVNARKRARSMGGTVEVTRREPRGTSLVWRAPVHR